ncbi:MAG: DNA gyrase subunit A, partial [Bacillota bacterium]|nr:DNA gyrase subunit A [Bacillota bacterium]
MDNNIIIGDFSNEMSTRYLSYAMDVIINRALPDVRDGLKPVHRRILYDMYQLGLMPNKSYKKSARVVGDVLGKYHPHGDTSVYDALVKLAQNFRMRYPLIDGHGNFGSIDGDSAAAMRYTETKLKPISLQMLDNTNEDIVKFMPNFDGEETEPTVLPTKFPNLLINGSSGIAVGMTTEIPPHNLIEVIEGVIYKIKNPTCNLADVMQYIKSPDFPTGAIILNKNDLYDMYKTGKGKIIIRAKYHIEDTKKYKQIVFTEIPYNTIKSKIIENVATLMMEKDKILQNIIDIRDESDRNGIRIVIDLRKNQDENIILKQLFMKTQLQKNFNAIFCAL